MNSKKLNPIKMLGLKLPTDPRWVDIVEKNIEEGKGVRFGIGKNFAKDL